MAVIENNSELAVNLYLRFDVTMENTISVHVVDTLENLVHIKFNALLRQVVSSSLDCFVHVHIHQFEN